MRDKREKTINPVDVRKAIYLIDSYRVDLFYDIGWINKKVQKGTLGIPFASIWKDLRYKMIKMASVTSRVRGVKRLAKFQLIFETMSSISVPLILVPLIIVTVLPETVLMKRSIAVVLTGATFSILMISLIARSMLGRKISARIGEHLRNNPETNKLKKPEIKKAVQLLIEELREYLHETGKKPKKHRIGINSLDYDHIRKVSNPKLWRKFYLAQIIL